MQKNHIIIAIILALLLMLFVLTRGSEESAEQALPQDTDQSSMTEETADAAQEDTEESQPEPQGPVELTIISPEEDTFAPRQARMYEATIANYVPSFSYNMADCRWKFYLNENNEEALYEEMTNRAIVTADKKNICGFTSTFIESRGELRVELNLDILDAKDNIIETLIAERKYRVQ
jgi:hypothetical protein